MDKARFIWLDGKFLPWDEAQVHVLTHSLHYGLGVFEGIRCYNTARGPAIFRFDEHMDRLFKSAKIVGIEPPFPRAIMDEATHELIDRNEQQSCYIRPLIFFGYGKMGVSNVGAPVQAAIATWAWGTYLGPDALEKGVRVRISSYARHHPNISMTKAKVTGNYANSQLAKVEAIRDGFQEALMVDPDGFVVEGTGENLFMVERGALVTPPLSSVLDGITRDTVETLGRDFGIPVHEERISRDRLYVADEVFFTGTAAEVTPIREIDRRPIADGAPGPITRRVQDRFFKIVRGEDPRAKDWLCPVRSGCSNDRKPRRARAAARGAGAS